MLRRTGELTRLVIVSAMLFGVSGCSGQRDSGPLQAIVSAVIPAGAQEIANPLRGQYEDMQLWLFPQANPAQKRYPRWPNSYDATIRVSWRQLQPTDPRTLAPDAPDERKYDFSVIDKALAQMTDRGMRLTLRVHAYNSCCNAENPNDTNLAIPDWLRAIPGTSTSYLGPPTGSSTNRVTQVVPNWNDPTYLADFGRLLAALGRRYDGDERLSVFEFSGYGDFSENHIAYLRDTLAAPGPSPDQSVKALGYYSEFKDQDITTASIRQLVAANVDAFPRTQLITNPPNPEIVRQLLADDVAKKLAAPVGIRSDCLGVYPPLPAWAESNQSPYVQNKDPLVAQLTQRLASAPVITEWCFLSLGGGDAQSYYEKALRDVVKYHVSMTSSVNFPESALTFTTPMDPKLYLLWARANVYAGYRYSVDARPGSQGVRDKVATIAVAWTNYGAAATTEKWVPNYQLVDFSGALIRTIPSTVELKKLVSDEGASGSANEPRPASATESVAVNLTGLAPGHYTLRASVAWQQHKPNASSIVNYQPMQLARDGRDGSGRYAIATLDIPRDEVTSGP